MISLQDLASPVAAFVRDVCTVGAECEIEIASIFEAWKMWCEINNHRPGSAQVFGKDLRAVIPTIKSTRPRDGDNRRRSYIGVSLTASHNGETRGPRGPDGRAFGFGPHGPQAIPMYRPLEKGEVSDEGALDRLRDQVGAVVLEEL